MNSRTTALRVEPARAMFPAWVKWVIVADIVVVAAILLIVLS